MHWKTYSVLIDIKTKVLETGVRNKGVRNKTKCET